MTLKLILAFVIAFAVSAVVGFFLVPYLKRIKAGQSIKENGPTWHMSKQGTPTMGGIMFILGAGVTVFILGWSFMLEGVFWHLYVYLFALIFGLIGFVDDYRKVRQHQNEGLTAKQKFVLQLLAAVVFLCLMRYEGLLTNDLYIPFVNVTLTVNWIVYLIFAAFVIVGCVNSVNLTDGIDGLASSVTAVVMAFFMGAAMIWKFTTLGIFSSALCGSLVGFYALYNRHPAKCFMGDTGSLTIGMMTCILSLKLLDGFPVNHSMQQPNAFFLAYSPLIIPCFDVVRVYLHRVRNGKNPFLPDKNHIHHKMLAVGMRQRTVMIAIVLVSVCFTLCNILLSRYINVTLLLILDIFIWILGNLWLTRRIHIAHSKL